MRMKIYAGILVVFLLSVSAIAAYATSNNTTGDIVAEDLVAEDSSNICTNTQAAGNSCTSEQNCGLSSCGALEGRSCGCKRDVCQTC